MEYEAAGEGLRLRGTKIFYISHAIDFFQLRSLSRLNSIAITTSSFDKDIKNDTFAVNSNLQKIDQKRR